MNRQPMPSMPVYCFSFFLSLTACLLTLNILTLSYFIHEQLLWKRFIFIPVILLLTRIDAHLHIIPRERI